MKKLTVENLENIALGATLLGSGGGGDPEFDLLRTKALLEQYGPISMIELEELDDDDLVVPLAFIGAPLVSIEKIASGKETRAILEEIERYYGKKPRAFVSCEIGGSNAFCAMQAALDTGLCVVDADTIGRAFPRLEMSSCHLFGCVPSPAFIADSLGTTLYLKSQSASIVENYFRLLCQEMGSSALVALYIMTGKEAKKALIAGSVSLAEELGIRLKKQSISFDCVGTGVIVGIEQELNNGFLEGKIEVRGENSYTIEYQNEYLLVHTQGKRLITTPDIIALICTETGLPLSVEMAKFGLGVHIVKIPAPAIWTSEKAMQLVGPDAFGYKERV
jgi:uncharacterized protein